MNDIYTLPFSGTIVTYADDTCLVVSAENEADLYKYANADLFIISKWLAAYSFKVNFQKTQFLHFSLGVTHLDASRKLILHDLGNIIDCSTSACCCACITEVKSTKYLGVIIDNNLNFKPHVNMVLQKVRFGLYALARLKHITNVKFLKMIYFAFIQSHFQYCISVWGGIHDSTVNSLILLQKRAIRIISNADFYAHTAELFSALSILPFRSLYLYKVALFAIKRNILETLPRSLSVRTNYYVYPFVPRSARILRSFFIHLVNLVNLIHLSDFSISDTKLIKEAIQNIDVAIVLAKP